jgi:AbrB family looped-hinge helix DNA binding protein
MRGTEWFTVTVGPQGRIVLPADLRKAMSISVGDRMAVRIEGSQIVLQRQADLLREMQQEFREASGRRNPVDELLEERRRAFERERREIEGP